MAKLGEVVSIYDEKYGVETRVPGVLTGVRTVRLIPFTANLKLGPTLTIAGERTPIKYPGQEAYCKYCLVPEHMGRTCAQTKRESYADMAKRTSAPIPPPTAQKIPASKTSAPNQQQKGKKSNVSRPVHTSVAQIRLDLARRNNLSHEKEDESSWTTLQSEKKTAQTPLKTASQPSPTSATASPSIVPSTSTPMMEVESNTESAVKPSMSERDTTEATKMTRSKTAAASERARDAADTGRHQANAPGRKTGLVSEVLGRYDTASEGFKVPRDRSPPVKLPPVKLPPSKPGEATDSDTGSVSSVGSTRGLERTRKNRNIAQITKEEERKESGAMET
ncbi:hypothetical protein ZHAS_00001150 [Anopheles sinensis]|uniref:Uncharacterized protein n=1 Tax=Anopheles sinensis TaxID=74873 RepID=A0A084VB32_ANOSI|nr:hypothetical protein ZHAS_00001150 [Anopheles sinensis]